MMKLNPDLVIPSGVYGVFFDNTLTGTPASTNLKTRVIRLNPFTWGNLNIQQQQFVLYHEAGHLNLQTFDEHQADAYASLKYFGKNLSPKQSVKALTEVLPTNSGDIRLDLERESRIKEQYRRAVWHDAIVNNNPKAVLLLNKIQQMEKELLTEDEASFLGLGKKAKEQRAQKFELKKSKKESKIDLRKSKAQAKILRAEAKQTRAEKGMQSDANGILGGIGNLANSVLNRGGNQPEPQTNETQTNTDDKIMGMNKKVVVILGVVLVVVIIAGVIYFKKKKA